MNLENNILLESDGLIVINKEAGFPTSGNKLDEPGSVQFSLMETNRRMIWAVHQLDKYTTGLNFFVRRKKMVAEWTAHLKLGRKIYLGVCEGLVDEDYQLIDQPLDYDPDANKQAVIPGGKESQTRVWVVARAKGRSLIQVEILTGRTHQIRVHLAYIGHPLVGDVVYGKFDEEINRQALHAWRIYANDEEFTAPVPADMESLFGEFELKEALEVIDPSRSK